MPPEPQRAAALAAARDDDAYASLQAALAWLARQPDDVEVRLLALRQFARLGLCGPAVELVDDAADLLNMAPDLAGPVAALRRQPSGRVSWAESAERFERQLALAARRFAAIREHEALIRAGLRDIELYRCADGNLLLSRRRDRQPREWLPAVLHWERLLGRFTLLPATRVTICPPYALENVGLGHALRTIFDGTSRMLVNFSPQIHLFETNPAQLAAWLALADVADILASERFYLWFGPDGPAAFVAFWRARPHDIPPRHVIRQPGWGPGATPAAGAAVEQALREADQREATERKRVSAVLRGRSEPAWYAGAFAARHERPLRIVGVTSRHTTFLQYSMRDIQHAAAALGHEMRLLIEPDDHTPTVARDRVLAAIADFEPHLIVMLDHNRKEYAGLYDFPIPFCNWIQDDLPNLFGPGRGAGLAPYDLVVGTIGAWRAGQSGYPDGQWLHVRTPVSTQMFSDEPVDAADLARYACDLAFVSNLSIDAGAFLEEQRRAAAPGVRRLMEALFDDLGPRIERGDAPASPVQVNGLTRQIAARLGLEVSDAQADALRQGFTERLINIFFRHQVLTWASEMGLDLRLYGRGWEQHPTLAKHARGVAQHGYPLRAIFQASRLNLQAFPYTAVHQRLLEGLAAGGFMLVRRTPLDTLGPLVARVERRCVELGIRDERALLAVPDAALRADVAELQRRLYAPAPLYRGFVRDLWNARQRPCRFEAGALLPDYEHVSFGTRSEFEALAPRHLADEAGRREIARRQRAVIVRHFSYHSALERVLNFAAERFAALAGADTHAAAAADASPATGAPGAPAATLNGAAPAAATPAAETRAAAPAAEPCAAAPAAKPRTAEPAPEPGTAPSLSLS